jgi:hypothetical protein
MNAYTNVNTPVTSTYGVSRPSATSTEPKGSYCFSACTPLVCANVAIRPNAATMTAGPITMTLRYSLTRRMRLRGCATRHTKLKLSSTFWIIETVVYSRTMMPSEPSTSPRARSTNPMIWLVSS